MANDSNNTVRRLREALKIVATGLDGREPLSRGEIEALQRELETLAVEGQLRFSSAEQLKAERIIAFTWPTMPQPSASRP